MGSLAPVDSGERLRQRYDEQFRLVAGCIPYRLKQDFEDYDNNLIDRLEVLMITSPNRDDLVFPKGGWEKDETEVEAACREALEEAGVIGNIKGTLGIWVFRSKSSESKGTMEGSCRGSMYALEVTEELPSWPEKATHQRRWLTVHEAWRLCRYDWMREALNKCLRFLSEEASPHAAEFDLYGESVPNSVYIGIVEASQSVSLVLYVVSQLTLYPTSLMHPNILDAKAGVCSVHGGR